MNILYAYIFYLSKILAGEKLNVFMTWIITQYLFTLSSDFLRCIILNLNLCIQHGSIIVNVLVYVLWMYYVKYKTIIITLLVLSNLGFK